MPSELGQYVAIADLVLERSSTWAAIRLPCFNIFERHLSSSPCAPSHDLRYSSMASLSTGTGGTTARGRK